MPKKSLIEINKKYGRVTIKNMNGRDRHGHQIYQYQCDCGNIGHGISSFFLRNANIRCKRCAEKEIGQAKKINILGKTIKGLKIIEEAGVDTNGRSLYLCRCIYCGSEKIKIGSTIRFKNSNRCVNCPPDYNFVFKEDYVIGTLQDGTNFLIDKDSVSSVKKLHWRKKTNGYIVSTTRHQSKKYLHRYVLGLDGDIIIDHKNRDKTDCRIKNLRLCSSQQNSWNKGLQSNNTTGYVGVSYSYKRNSYMSRIGYNNKYFTLGTYKNVIKAAQVHNIAAEFFFGEYMGHVNAVPEPDIGFRQHIIKKCKKYRNRIEAVEKQHASFLLRELKIEG